MSSGEGGTRQILSNAGALLLAYVLPRVFTVASVVVAARWLGAERFGAYGAAAAFAVIAAVLATLGMMPLLVREMARTPGRAAALLKAAHLVKLATGAVMLGGAWVLVGALFPEDPDVRAAALVLCFGWVLNSFAENLAAYYQAMERMGRWTQASGLFGIVAGVVGVLLLLSTGSVVAYCWGFVVGWAAAAAWLMAGLPAGVRSGGRVSLSDLRQLVKGLAPFAVAFIGLTVYSKMDVLLLERWTGPVQVGLYAAAYKFVDVAQALVIVAASAVYPRLARTADPGGSSDPLGRRSTELVLLVSVPVGVALYLAARPLVLLLFGPTYGGSAQVLARLGLLLPLMGLSIHSGYVLGAAGRMAPVGALYGLGVAANFGFNAVFIPEAGAVGAAEARLASETLLVVGFLLTLRLVTSSEPRRRALVATGIVLLTGLGAAAVPDPSAGWLRAGALLVACVPIYVGARVVDRGDVNRVQRALASFRRTAEGGRA